MGERVWAFVEVLWPVDLPDPFDAEAVKAWPDAFRSAGLNQGERFAQAEALLGMMTEAIDYCRDDQEFREDGWVRLADAQVNYGTAFFSETLNLLGTCQALGIAFRCGDEGAPEWAPSETQWKPGMEGPWERTKAGDDPALTKSEFMGIVEATPPDALGQALTEWFAGVDFTDVLRPQLFPSSQPTQETP